MRGRALRSLVGLQAALPALHPAFGAHLLGSLALWLAGVTHTAAVLAARRAVDRY